MSNDRFQCPFCESFFPLINSTFSVAYPSFDSENWASLKGAYGYPNLGNSGLAVSFFKCPQCDNVSVYIEGKGNQYSDGYHLWFFPLSKARQFPEYVPKAIRDDYAEAYSIIELSPKASATLSRRCVQGMIRNLWNVDRSNLYQEIDSIKDLIDPMLWKSLNSIRSIGNIGAHMEKDINLIIDIDPNEAEKLIKLVELLVKEWYIVPFERDQLLAEIQIIGEDKETQRSSNSDL